MWPPKRSVGRIASSRFTGQRAAISASELSFKSLVHHIGAEGPPVDGGRRQTDAVDRDGVTLREVMRELGRDAQAHTTVGTLHVDHLPEAGHQSREQLTTR